MTRLDTPINRSAIGLLLLSALTVLQGCSRRHVRFEDMPLPDPILLLSRIDANREALKDFSGSGSLEVVNSKMGRTMMGASLKHIRPDHLLLSLYGPMGVLLGSLLVDDSCYELSYGMPAVHAEGDLADLEFPEEFGFIINGQELLRILMPLEFVSAPPDSLSIQKDYRHRAFQLNWVDSGIRHALGIDPIRPVCRDEWVISSEGDTLIVKEMNEFSRRNGVHFPAEWSFRFGKAEDENFLRFKMRRLSINGDLEPGDLRLPMPNPADSLKVGHG